MTWHGESRRHREAALKGSRGKRSRGVQGVIEGLTREERFRFANPRTPLPITPSKQRDSDGDGVPDVRDCQPFNPRRQDEALAGHVSPESAYVIEDYPYGFRLRTQMRVWVESNKRGERFVSQTLNPKSGRWNKPKAGTYSMVVVLYVGNDGRVSYRSLDINSRLEEVDLVVNNWGDLLTVSQKKKINLIKAYIAGQKHYTWTCRGEGEGGPSQSLEEQRRIISAATRYELDNMRRRGEVI